MNPINIFKLIKKIELEYSVDSIKLKDGTKIWNLIRILLYFYIQFKDSSSKEEQISFKTFLNQFGELLAPVKLSNRKIDICGFSGTENRKLRDGKFYDIYLDPLYNILGDRLWVFEWPAQSGHRRKYQKKIFSKHYIPMHIPLFSNTFWNIGFYKVLGRKKFYIKAEGVLKNIITRISQDAKVDKNELKNNIYDAIAIFFYMKEFFIKIMRSISPKAVLIICGYGRFHMALSQACKELSIPSIELQHGIITKFHLGYIKTIKSENKDCIPEYLFTYGDFFSDIVRKGNLFDPDKVISIGFPYLEEFKESHVSKDYKLKKFLSNYSTTLLITSQWTVSDEIKLFVKRLSKELDKLKINIGIIFKPHPRDWRNHKDLEQYQNIFLTSKYDDIYVLLKMVDIHSTVYSTSGLEALAYGKPNIFIEVRKASMPEIIDIVDNRTSFIAVSSKEFINHLENIVSNYESISKETQKQSEKFFKSNAKENFEKFLNTLLMVKNYD